MKVALLPGDGIGKEIIPEAVKVLKALRGVSIEFEEAPIAGAGVDAFDDPLPPSTLDLCLKADAMTSRFGRSQRTVLEQLSCESAYYGDR